MTIETTTNTASITLNCSTESSTSVKLNLTQLSEAIVPDSFEQRMVTLESYTHIISNEQININEAQADYLNA